MEYGKDAVINILMRRDNMTHEEATNTLNGVIEMFNSGEFEPEELMCDELGLEPDYIFALFEK